MGGMIMLEEIVNRMELILSLTVNLLLILGWILTRINAFRKKKTIQTFFNSNRITIYFPGRNMGRSQPVIAAEDFYAAYKLSEFIRKGGVEVDLKHIPPDTNLKFDIGSVIICGPKSSPVAKEILDSDPYYKFKEENGVWKFVETATNNELISPMDKNPPENKDIAYLGRLKQDLNSHDHECVTFIAGIHAIGSYGVVHYLSNFKILKQINKDIGDRRFSALIFTYYDPETRYNV
jgi:hypothetical protein